MDNVNVVKNQFLRIVQSNLISESPVLVTLTFKDHITEISEAYTWFRVFNQRMRYHFGKDFKYIAVPEFTKIGRVHFHALYWGLPLGIVASERVSRTIANIWGLGFIDLKTTDGSLKIAGYLCKYMLKTICDKRLFGEKAYVCSRNVLRPVSVSGEIFTPFLDDIVGVDNSPVRSVEYDTMWLGRCSYKKYIT